jgi:hypothetical protein
MLITKDNFPSEIIAPPKLPWGYFRSLEDPTKAIANIQLLEELSVCFDYLDGGQSVRQVLDHMEGKGIEISKTGLHRLWIKHRGSESPVLRKRKNDRANASRKNKHKPKALTQAEKDAKKTKYKIAAEKRRITAAEKRIEKYRDDVIGHVEMAEAIKEMQSNPVVINRTIIEKVIDEVERPVAFRPNEGPQLDFLAADEREVLYGGSAGGGKSFALIADPMRYFEDKHFNGLLLRRTNDELRELIRNQKILYASVFPEAKFNEKDKEWRFPSGATLWMSYLDRDDDVLRYQGQAFTWIGVDELTQWPSPAPWDYLRSRNRKTHPDYKGGLYMRATTNPGGPGHAWVKRMFVDPAPWGQAFWAQDIETGKTLVDPENGVPLFKRRFIPAKLSDNPYLYDDGVYRTNLLSLPEAKRAQLLEGDWTLADGAAFPEFRESIHVIEPFEIPSTWQRFRAADYGYASYSAVLWFAIDPMDEQIVVYRELYVHHFTGEALSLKVKDIERHERVSYGVLDSSVWHKRGEGPSVAEVMISKGVRWKPSDRSAGSRVNGKNRLHELLKVDETTGRPGIVFCNTLRQTISDLQSIPTSPNGDDDIDSRYRSDHTYDALRYGIMSRPKVTPWWMEEGRGNPFQPADRMFGY